MNRRIALFVSLIASMSLFGQISREQPSPSQPPTFGSEIRPILDVPIPVPPQPEEVQPQFNSATELELPVFARTPHTERRIGANDIVPGTNGDVFFNSPSPFVTTGVLSVAKPSWPDIGAKLGTATSASSFVVFDVNDLALFRIRGNGSALLQRDQNSETRLDIANADPGSSASSALRFMLGPAATGALLMTGAGYSSPGYANALSLYNFVAGPVIFGTTAAERMRIDPNGYLRINTPGPTGIEARLFVQHGVDNSTAVFLSHQPWFEVGSPNQTDYGLRIQTTEQVASGATNNGALYGSYTTALQNGPGTLFNATAGYFGVGTAVVGTLNTAFGLRVNFTQAAGSTITTGYGLHIGDVPATNDYAVYQAGTDDSNFFAGDLTIGNTGSSGMKLTVNGDANFTGTVTGGNIQAKYQDLAEWVSSRQDLTPGTVVVIDPHISNGVLESSVAYDTAVAGVVSAQPGIILGEAGEAKEQIATTGRVRVRVDATHAPIRAGDLLVTSAIPGVAMKSTPVDVGSISMHRPGTIIGKALEPLESGVGEILVLLSLQ